MMTMTPRLGIRGRHTPPQPRSWRLAARDAVGVSSGMISFGLVLGMTVELAGRDGFAAILGAAAVFGGSAQLTMITMLDHGSAWWLAVASGVVVNLRLLLYSAAIGDRFSDQPRVFRWLAPHLIIDQTFLMAQSRRQLTGAAFRGYWLWLGGFVLVVWVGSVATGVFLAPVLPPLPHLTLVCTAMFIGLLLPRLVNRPAVAAATAGGVTAAAVSAATPALGILAGALAGVVAGVAVQRRNRTSPLHHPSSR